VTSNVLEGERLYLRDDVELEIEAERDQSIVSRHIWRYDWAIKALRSVTGARQFSWLDCACGSGYGTVRASKYAPMIGADPSERAIAYARKHYAPFNVAYLVASTATVWSLVGRISGVLCVETLEHLPKYDQREWIALCSHCLEDEGALALTCAVGTGTGGSNPHHVYEPPAVELRAVLDASFASVEMRARRYQSTYGPAIQALALCRAPIE
jgi:SAM-dependent methyltransferase